MTGNFFLLIGVGTVIINMSDSMGSLPALRLPRLTAFSKTWERPGSFIFVLPSLTKFIISTFISISKHQ